MLPRYRFGQLELDPASWSLTHAGIPTGLGERGVRLLHALIRQPGQFLGKDLLLREAWPGVVVEESNLSVQVSAIRRVLGKAAGAGQIDTLARRGYRFVGAVTLMAPGDPRPPGTAPDSPTAARLPTAAEGCPAPALTGLHAPATALVGRSEELAALWRALQDHRLVTLHGAGGMGKTRLAQEIVATAHPAFPDGVAGVVLGADTDMDGVTEALAAALHLEAPRSGAPLEAVSLFLRERRMLVVLDNAEAQIDAAARLASTLLREAPQVRVLATSREILRVRGEHVLALGALACPAADQPISAQEALAYGAVQLFVERAQAARGGFTLTNRQLPVITTLCRQLDGSPLAIEMAAARLRMLSAESLLEGLRDRFQLLSCGQRDAPLRHQTLRAVMDWSHSLLSPAEQVFLRRLAVFAGTVSFDLARATLARDAAEADAALEALGGLIDKSLVRCETVPGGITHLHLLESTRAYALERLRASPDDWIDQRFAEQLLVVLRAGTRAWPATPTRQWLDRHAIDLPTLRSALHWCFARPAQVALGILLVSETAAQWRERSFHREGRQWFELAQQHADDTTPLEARARIALRLAVDTNFGVRERYGMACVAIELCRGLDDPLLLADGLYSAGRSVMTGDNAAAALPLLDEAEQLMRHQAPGKLLASLLIARASAHFFMGDAALAKRVTEEAMSMAALVGFDQGLERSLSNLAEYHYGEGAVTTAVSYAREAISRARASGNLLVLSSTLVNQAGYLLSQDQVAAAGASVSEGLRLTHALGDRVFFTHAAEHLALVAIRSGHPVEAALLLGHVDHHYTTAGFFRSHNELVTWRQLITHLEAAFPPADLARLLTQGASLDADAVLQLANTWRNADVRPAVTRTG